MYIANKNVNVVELNVSLVAVAMMVMVMVKIVKIVEKIYEKLLKKMIWKMKQNVRHVKNLNVKNVLKIGKNW